MDKKTKSLEERIAALEQRLATLERSDSGAKEVTLLVAPVRIVDKVGKLVAEIASTNNDNAIRIYNTQGEAVASIGADGTESGYLAIRNKRGKLVGFLDVERYGARFQLISNNEDSGGVALFGADSDEAGGGVNIIASDQGGGISLWAGQASGEIRIEDSEGHELIIANGNEAKSVKD